MAETFSVFIAFGCMAQWCLTGELPYLALDLLLTDDHLMWSKPTAKGQPTRPTQPFFLSG